MTSHETLKRNPAGWPADHAMADFFRYKDIVFLRALDDAEVYSRDLPDIVADGFAP